MARGGWCLALLLGYYTVAAELLKRACLFSIENVLDPQNLQGTTSWRHSFLIFLFVVVCVYVCVCGVSVNVCGVYYCVWVCLCLYMPMNTCVRVWEWVGVLRFMVTKPWLCTCHDIVFTSAFHRQRHPLCPEQSQGVGSCSCFLSWRRGSRFEAAHNRG